MAEILTDDELNEIKGLAHISTATTVLRLVDSHRALAAERDSSVDKERELALKLVLLTEERDRLKEDAELAAEDADRLRAELHGVYGAMLTVESFRQRAVRAIRDKGEEWRQQGERWQQKFSREKNPIVARQDMSDRDGAFNHMSAAFAIIELVKSLPLEPEEKL